MRLFVGLAGRSVWKHHHVYLSTCMFTLAKEAGSLLSQDAEFNCGVLRRVSIRQVTLFNLAHCDCMWRRVYPRGLSFECGGECLCSFGISGIGWKVFFLRNSTQHSKHSIRSRCVCSCMYGNSTPPSPSHHNKTPSSRLSPIFISPLLSRYLFHNLCSECQGKMERSLLASLLCVWALSSLSAASGERVCVCGCLRKKKMKGLWEAFQVDCFFKWFDNE